MRCRISINIWDEVLYTMPGTEYHYVEEDSDQIVDPFMYHRNFSFRTFSVGESYRRTAKGDTKRSLVWSFAVCIWHT